MDILRRFVVFGIVIFFVWIAIVINQSMPATTTSKIQKFAEIGSSVTLKREALVCPSSDDLERAVHAANDRDMTYLELYNLTGCFTVFEKFHLPATVISQKRGESRLMTRVRIKDDPDVLGFAGRSFWTLASYIE